MNRNRRLLLKRLFATLSLLLGSASYAAGAPPAKPADTAPLTATAVFAGGCFWGVDAVFKHVKGVSDVVSGYAGGSAATATYEQVSRGGTGHAEAVRVRFNPAQVSYRQLLQVFFRVAHDPTQLDRQGPDVGSQYRSGIWTASEEQRREAEAYVKELQASGRFGTRRIVTRIEPAKTFWPAEDYHQDYIAATGRACHVTNPW